MDPNSLPPQALDQLNMLLNDPSLSPDKRAELNAFLHFGVPLTTLGPQVSALLQAYGVNMPIAANGMVAGASQAGAATVQQTAPRGTPSYAASPTQGQIAVTKPGAPDYTVNAGARSALTDNPPPTLGGAGSTALGTVPPPTGGISAADDNGIGGGGPAAAAAAAAANQQRIGSSTVNEAANNAKAAADRAAVTTSPTTGLPTTPSTGGGGGTADPSSIIGGTLYSGAQAGQDDKLSLLMVQTLQNLGIDPFSGAQVVKDIAQSIAPYLKIVMEYSGLNDPTAKDQGKQYADRFQQMISTPGSFGQIRKWAGDTINNVGGLTSKFDEPTQQNFINDMLMASHAGGNDITNSALSHVQKANNARYGLAQTQNPQITNYFKWLATDPQASKDPMYAQLRNIIGG